jgi:hypothetical protein
MKASNYWKNQADELLGKKKDQTPKNKIQKNNTNTEENDADVLDDSVLDVDSNFFAIDRQEKTTNISIYRYLGENYLWRI